MRLTLARRAHRQRLDLLAGELAVDELLAAGRGRPEPVLAGQRAASAGLAAQVAGRVLTRGGPADAALTRVRLLDHPLAAAYCLPGVRPLIVVSRGVIDALSRAELCAVVSHEKAHARGRHDLVIQPFRAWRQTFPFLAAAGRRWPPWSCWWNWPRTTPRGGGGTGSRSRRRCGHWPPPRRAAGKPAAGERAAGRGAASRFGSARGGWARAAAAAAAGGRGRLRGGGRARLPAARHPDRELTAIVIADRQGGRPGPPRGAGGDAENGFPAGRVPRATGLRNRTKVL